MRRLIAAALISAAVAGPALAQGQPPLRCAVDGTFAPHAFPSLQGGVQGFQIDLFREVARRMGREIVIDSAAFSGLIPALNAGPLRLPLRAHHRDARTRRGAAVHRGLHLDRTAVRHPPRHAADPVGGGPARQDDQREQGHAL